MIAMKTVLFAFCLSLWAPAAQQLWTTYEGGSGPGAGKHVVLVSGDEEYRSEEALPQLGRILAIHHGFKCTVVFAIDPETGEINPMHNANIPGLQALDSADLMVIATRFRDLPDEQMQHIDDFLRRGGAVIGLRTATHAFNVKGNKPWAHYGNGYGGDKTEWKDGFGRLVLGEKWISHHGAHKSESTRGIVVEGQEDNPILRGVAPNSIWGPTDVYGVRLPLPDDAKPLVLGQVLVRKGPALPDDPHFGMRPDDEPLVGKKNEPMMPIAWTKSYRLPGGEIGQSFTTTMGASTDLVAEGTRRLIVNAALVLTGLEVPPGGANVEIVGEFEPTRYSAGQHRKGIKPSDLAD